MSAVTPPDLGDLPAGFASTVGWSDAAQERLAHLGERLVEANARMNLVGAATVSAYWRRHVLDSAQLLWYAPQARIWADIGSGGGFPGLVLGALLKDREGARVHLIESIGKKCAFLRAASEALDLPCEVHEARAETLKLKVEAVTARACAPLDRLLGYAQGLLTGGARGLFLKGERVEDEIAVARRSWRFTETVWPSLSDPRGRVLEIAGGVHGRR
ncbi:MAG: 16S rRNA (guanine(527)-N(7))-methyltransferase RsmG [Alphaproteobacteria bacterium]|nr:16S rRNA (guanine(527)-N(7))-methyltransferase RsmG [Alphaproteobacteria bacterium]